MEELAKIKSENEQLRKMVADLQLQAENERLKKELVVMGAERKDETNAIVLAEKDRRIAELQIKLEGSSLPSGQYTGLTFDCQLADSGQAVVYKGVYRGITVAAKVFKLLKTEEHLKQYRDEVDILIRLRHKNILNLITCYEHPRPCLVTEFMPQGDLHHYLDIHGPMAPLLATKVALGIAEGCEYLHSCRICHKDLKSLNVLLDHELRPVIADFGFSRIAASSVMPISRVSGTPQWMAPEVMIPGGTYSTKLDVFSFGVILWEMLSGSLPYYKERLSVDQIKTYVLAGGRLIIEECWPPSLVAVMRHCWQTNPNDRPTMADLVCTLSALLRQPNLFDASGGVTAVQQPAQIIIESIPHQSGVLCGEEPVVPVPPPVPSLRSQYTPPQQEVDLLGFNPTLSR